MIIWWWPAPKHKVGRGHWDLASCQDQSNSVQRFNKRSWKRLSQSEVGDGYLGFPISPLSQIKPFFKKIQQFQRSKKCPFEAFRSDTDDRPYELLTAMSLIIGRVTPVKLLTEDPFTGKLITLSWGPLSAACLQGNHGSNTNYYSENSTQMWWGNVWHHQWHH